MKKTVVVKVTKRDIAFGVREDAGRCPIARALKRRTGARDISVCCDEIQLEGPGDPYGIDMPSAGREFVKTFDRKGPEAVKPITLRLCVPEEYARRRRKKMQKKKATAVAVKIEVPPRKFMEALAPERMTVAVPG